jgi:hypothetical protein
MGRDSEQVALGLSTQHVVKCFSYSEVFVFKKIGCNCKTSKFCMLEFFAVFFKTERREEKMRDMFD